MFADHRPAGVAQAVDHVVVLVDDLRQLFRRYCIVTASDVRMALRRTQEYTAHEMEEAVATEAARVIGECFGVSKKAILGHRRHLNAELREVEAGRSLELKS